MIAGILAAHFDDERPRHGPRGVVADEAHPDVLRTGEHDAVDAGVVDELLAGRSAASGHEVEDAVRYARLHHDFRELVAEQRRDRRRLEHHRVAGDERAARRSGRKRQRKIERRDDGPHAVGPQHAGVLFAGPEDAERGFEPMMRRDLIAVVLDEIRRFLDVADAFEPVLAGFVTHERRQLPAVRANGLGRPSSAAATRSAPRPRAPAGEGPPRRGDRVAHLFAARALKPSEQDAGVDRAAILELARRRGPPVRR